MALTPESLALTAGPAPSLLILGLLAAARPTAAQEPRAFGPSAWLRQGNESPIASAGRTCAILPSRDAPSTQFQCDVIRFAYLGRSADTAWWYALYRHGSLESASSTVRSGAGVELELVLLAGVGDRPNRLLAVAHSRQDAAMVSDMSMTLGNHPVGELLGVEFCLDGTGGCWQELLLRVGSRWRLLDDPRGMLTAELGRLGRLSSATGGRLASTYVDVATLTGHAALYESNDANCCPSHDVAFQLALTPSGLRLLVVEVIPVNR